jgi:ubiquitin carboxyl-terminal hydrolase 14
MRKVTFPAELDVVEFCTEELRKQLVPVRDKVREIRKDEVDIERSRKRQKLSVQQEEEHKKEVEETGGSMEPMQKKQKAAEAKGKTGDKDGDTAMEENFKTDAEHEAGKIESLRIAKQELYDLLKQNGPDNGTNQSGLYELRGVITHQGASADSGHYTAYVKQQERKPDNAQSGGKRREEDGKWWWFNDDKVTEVEAEKIETLAGGGTYTPDHFRCESC